MEEVWDHCNYYDTLRIPQTATAREIRISYLKLAKEYHPDHNDNHNATLMFERISEAYHTLSDEEVRRKYDVHLRISSGALSKSYWRQLFCYWNRDKAIQVGISTLLAVSGGALLIASMLATPSGVGLPLSILGGAIGGGIFSAGIGGLSVSLSRQAAINGNKDYQRWLKYSFWYGIAGAVAGAASAGVSSVLSPAIASTAGSLAATGAANGAIYGISFQVTDGIASERWLQLVKQLRIDAIALDLAFATLTGASIGVVFHTALISSHAASAVLGQAKYGVKHFVKAGTFAPEKTQPKNLKLNIGKNDALETDSESDTHSGEIRETSTNLLPLEYNELEEESISIIDINEAIDLYQTISQETVNHVIQVFDKTKATRIQTMIEYTMEYKDINDIKIESKIIRGSGTLVVPEKATMIQISFSRSSFGKYWAPITASNNVPITYSYKNPTTRRFFLEGTQQNARVSQIRDEYEQLVVL